MPPWKSSRLQTRVASEETLQYWEPLQYWAPLQRHARESDDFMDKDAAGRDLLMNRLARLDVQQCHHSQGYYPSKSEHAREVFDLVGGGRSTPCNLVVNTACQFGSESEDSV